MAIFLRSGNLKDELTETAHDYLCAALSHGIEKKPGSEDALWAEECRLALRRAEMFLFERDQWQERHQKKDAS